MIIRFFASIHFIQHWKADNRPQQHILSIKPNYIYLLTGKGIFIKHNYEN